MDITSRVHDAHVSTKVLDLTGHQHMPITNKTHLFISQSEDLFTDDSKPIIDHYRLGQRYSNNASLVLTSAKFQSASLCDQPLPSYSTFLRNVDQNNSKMTWDTKSWKAHPIWVTTVLCPRVTDFSKFRVACDYSYSRFQTSAPKGHVMKMLVSILVMSSSPKFHSPLLYHHPFSCYWPFLNKSVKLPPDDREHYRVKDRPYM